MAVEESPFIIKYDCGSGGKRMKGTEGHLRNHMEMILLAHKKPDNGDRDCTINRRVTMEDLFGITRGGPLPMTYQEMNGIKSLPPGAPNGGPRCTFPAKVLTFLINR